MILATVLVFAAMATAMPALAAASSAACVARGNPETTYREIANRPESWSCSSGRWSVAAPRIFLRFDLRQSPAEKWPDVLETRLSRFEHMTILAIDANGNAVSRDYAPDAMTLATSGWRMEAPLPRAPGKPATVVVVIDGARHPGLLGMARLGPARDQAVATRHELLIAMLCGLLCMPLLFNFAFYRVLRKSFVLWHASVVLFMLLHTFVVSGLINRFFSMNLATITALSPITWVLAVGSAACFISSLTEPGMLSRRQHLLLQGVAPWTICWALFYLYAGGPLRPFAAICYFAAYIPVILVMAWSMATGIKRGSRAIRFQVLAWSPIIVTGSVRVASTLGLTEVPWDLLLEQHASLAFEVMITSLGVVDRFLVIKHQRDKAIAETKVLTNLAESDPLTGLLNRRAVRQRFAELRKEGYDTMAVIDLDFFKSINDSHGHTVGDRVLQSVAKALDPDQDTVAVRLGGEEFLLLLRGPGGAERAERRRRAIPQRVANQNPGLHMPVTASMGVIIFGANPASEESFTDLYAHCDRLLYESKHEGRNRSRVTALCEGLEPDRMPVIALG